MPTPTPVLGLQRAVATDLDPTYLTVDLAASLATLDGLFSDVAGHTHFGAGQGGSIMPLQEHVTFAAENTFDIGTGGGNRPRDMFLASHLSINSGPQTWALHVQGDAYMSHLGIGDAPRGDKGIHCNAQAQIFGPLGVGADSIDSAGIRMLLTLKGTDPTGIDCTPIFDLTTTGVLKGLEMGLGTQDGGYVGTDSIVNHIKTPDFRTGWMMVNNTGLRIDNQGHANVTNSWGIYVAPQSNSTGSQVGIYNGGTYDQAQLVTPLAPPATGSMRLYPKADGEFYKMDSAGVETPLSSGGGGASTAPWAADPTTGAWFPAVTGLHDLGTATLAPANVYATAQMWAPSIGSAAGMLVLRPTGANVELRRVGTSPATLVVYGIGGEGGPNYGRLVISPPFAGSSAFIKTEFGGTTNPSSLILEADGPAAQLILRVNGSSKWRTNVSGAWLPSPPPLAGDPGDKDIGSPGDSVRSLYMEQDISLKGSEPPPGAPATGLRLYAIGPGLFIKGADGVEKQVATVDMLGGGATYVHPDPFTIGTLTATNLTVTGITGAGADDPLTPGQKLVTMNALTVTPGTIHTAGLTSNGPAAVNGNLNVSGTHVVAGGASFGTGITVNTGRGVNQGSVMFFAAAAANDMQLFAENGSAYMWFVNAAGGLMVQSVSGASWCPVSASAFNVTSTSSVKTDLVPLEAPTALGQVLDPRVTPTSYTDTNGARQVGFIAEEMVQVVPEVVSLDDDGAPQGIHYGALVSVLWSAMRDLANRLSALEQPVGAPRTPTPTVRRRGVTA